MAENSVQVVGVIRFSVLTPTYYSERFDSVGAIAAHLFSPERMALRFRLFETLCLPSLLRQSDPGFEAVILTSEHLPAGPRDRLEALLEPYDHLHLVAAPPDKHYQLLKQAYASVPERGFSHRAAFRLDDDDALDMNFVARVKRLSASVLTMHDEDHPTILAFNRGFYVEMGGEGPNPVVDTCERAPLSVGATLLAPQGFSRNPYRFNHRAYAQHFNTFSDISVPGFIRTIHADNKSQPAKQGLVDQMRPEDRAAEIRDHFGLDMQTLEAL